MKTASALLTVIERVREAQSNEAISVLASAEIVTSESAMGECLSRATDLGATLEGTNWEIFEAIGKLIDERQNAAAEIRRIVDQALRSDEHVVQLGPALKEAEAKAVRLLTESVKPAEPTQQLQETSRHWSWVSGWSARAQRRIWAWRQRKIYCLLWSRDCKRAETFE